ncbi:MAG: metalloregulator ArsR/SmtB family transcription factor [Saprospiraceae bacterium]|nr:metalloregulator ArsR/SmtB family transcription factor [Saprospiraceae bacterium]
MNSRDLKNNIYNEISRIAKALSNANRLEIIDLLANGEKCVEDIALQTGISMANASQHLQTLKKERLVVAKKKGIQVCYSLASSHVYHAWSGIRDLSLATSPYVQDILNDNRKTHKYDTPRTWDDVKKERMSFYWTFDPKMNLKKGKYLMRSLFLLTNCRIDLKKYLKINW